nr:hypothetical protein [Bradyrhizobium diazoefficiens]
MTVAYLLANAVRAAVLRRGVSLVMNFEPRKVWRSCLRERRRAA